MFLEHVLRILQVLLGLSKEALSMSQKKKGNFLTQLNSSSASKSSAADDKLAAALKEHAAAQQVRLPQKYLVIHYALFCLCGFRHCKHSDLKYCKQPHCGNFLYYCHSLRTPVLPVRLQTLSLHRLQVLQAPVL